MQFSLFVMLLAAGLASQSFAAEAPAKTAPPKATDHTLGIVARVNNKEITRHELDMAVKGYRAQMANAGRPVPAEASAQLEAEVLERIVGVELIRQEGSAHVPTNVDAVVQQQLEAIKNRFNGEDGFRKALDSMGVTPGEYTRRIRDNAIVQETIKQLLERELKITPAEVQAEFDTHHKELVRQELVRASHILVLAKPGATETEKAAAKARIEAARALIKGGEKFADVAKKVSEDPRTKDTGGDLGLFPRGVMPAEVETAAFSLPANALSEAISTPYGYHLLIVTGREAARPWKFDEVKGRLEEILRARKGQELLAAHVKALREKGNVLVYLKPAPADKPAKAAPSTTEKK
jgi:parvulin-like peptidyl-prolyl isomerase